MSWLSPLPIELTAPSTPVMLVIASFPAAGLELIGHALGIGWGWRGALVLIAASVLRYLSPWRPEATHLFALVGWFGAWWVGLFIWGHP